MEKQFVKWLKEISRWSRDDMFVHWQGVSESELYEGRCYLYTHNNKYCIIAREKADGSTYLGCVVSARMPRAGEDWTRGHDMPDGQFNQFIWDNIKNAIIQNELVKIIKPVREVTDDTPEVGPSIGD